MSGEPSAARWYGVTQYPPNGYPGRCCCTDPKACPVGVSTVFPTTPKLISLFALVKTLTRVSQLKLRVCTGVLNTESSIPLFVTSPRLASRVPMKPVEGAIDTD